MKQIKLLVTFLTLLSFNLAVPRAQTEAELPAGLFRLTEVDFSL